MYVRSKYLCPMYRHRRVVLPLLLATFVSWSVIAGPPAEYDAHDPNWVGFFRGRVLDPEGKPLAGASLYVFRTQAEDAGPVRALTDAEGKFEFEAPDMTFTAFDGLPSRYPGRIVAAKEGLAPDWRFASGQSIATRPNGAKAATYELRLDKADVPVLGRMLDPIGKPLPHARVKVAHVWVPPNRDLDKYIEKLLRPGADLEGDGDRELYEAKHAPGLPIEARTDGEGRFRLEGLGRDWVVRLEVSTPLPMPDEPWVHVENTSFSVMTRDAAPIEREGEEAPLLGARFSRQMTPGAGIRGRVIDAETRRPISGMWVGPLQNVVNPLNRRLYPWTTDEEGRFEIPGFSPERIEREIVATPAPGMPYETAWKSSSPDEELVIECHRRIPFRLKVVDDIGMPVTAKVTYVDIQAAPLIETEVVWPICHAAKNADGTYSGFVRPGPGAVLVAVEGDYRSARVEPKAFFAPDKTDWTEQEKITAYGTTETLVTHSGRYRDTVYRGSVIQQSQYQAIVLVNPPADSPPLELSATVVRNKTRPVTVHDPDGQPFVGAEVYLRRRKEARSAFLRAATIPLGGLRPDEDDAITFLDRERKWIGYANIRGDTDQPVVVTMRTWGTITGRIRDETGQPFSRFNRIVVRADDGKANPYMRYEYPGEGQFRIDQVVPGMRLDAVALTRGTRELPARVFENLVLKPGEVVELGDFAVEDPKE